MERLGPDFGGLGVFGDRVLQKYVPPLPRCFSAADSRGLSDVLCDMVQGHERLGCVLVWGGKGWGLV